ncbi:MAG: Gfo/Idh/MocA family oxidoreductase [Syntrophobacterales bacterium]
MFKVKIYGAGSIGNHLTHACRAKGWDVLICDIDAEALERTRKDIYPSRYGSWDSEIRLVTVDNLPDENFDVVIIGTPPDSHLNLARKVLQTRPPKVLLIEKPLCTPSLEGAQEVVELQKASGTFVAVGYNHTLTENTKLAAQIIAQQVIGPPLTISAKFREHWGGIFAAHPWLRGPQDTYLGYFERGGGAGGEHSHAINIWQHFAHLSGMGRIVEVSAMLDMVDDGKIKYDRICWANVKTEFGFVGDIAQDVVTEPAQKDLRVQGTKGYLEWFVNLDGGHDAIRYWDGKNEVREELIAKTRPDDFKGEIDHVESILMGGNPENSPISLERGLDTMMVITALYLSHQNNTTVKINYEAGYRFESMEIL